MAEEIELNKVYLDDCFNIIELMPNKYLDLVIVDPPYGDDNGYGRGKKTIINNEDEAINYEFLEKISPKMKQDTSLYLFTNHKFCDKIRSFAIRMGYNYRMTCILVKNNFGMGQGFRNQYELCLILEKGKAKYNLTDMSNVWFMKHVAHTDDSHPHRKDYDIIRRIILHSSAPGELIFDGFMGSFTTAEACIKEGRNFVGTELDERWHKQGNENIYKLQNQSDIFTPRLKKNSNNNNIDLFS